MNEAEWLASTEPLPMLDFLHGKASDRKLRLFGVACCRRFWHKFSDNRSCQAVEVAERYADGLASAVELRAAHDGALQWDDLITKQDFEGVAYARVAADVARVLLFPLPLGTSALLRDIFGNPFRPATASASWIAWNDGAVPKLAQAFYDDRAFDRLPQLADPLEAAGCDNRDILEHCRSGDEHVRGCWVVDLLLGKS